MQRHEQLKRFWLTQWWNWYKVFFIKHVIMFPDSFVIPHSHNCGSSRQPWKHFNILEFSFQTESKISSKSLVSCQVQRMKTNRWVWESSTIRIIIPSAIILNACQFFNKRDWREMWIKFDLRNFLIQIFWYVIYWLLVIVREVFGLDTGVLGFPGTW